MARTDLLGCLSHSRNISGMPGGNVVTSGININFELRMNSLKCTHFFLEKGHSDLPKRDFSQNSGMSALIMKNIFEIIKLLSYSILFL